MVEKIIVSPEDVRGLGNIVSPKSTSDFTLSDADLSSATETVNGMSLTVYHMQLTSAGILTVAITVGNLVFRRVTVGTQITVTATAADRLGAAVSGVPVVLTIGGTTYDAVDTDSNGKVVKTYTTGASDVGTLYASAASDGYSTVTTSIKVDKHTSALTLSIADSSIAVGESFALSGTLSIDSTGASGLSVKIYQDDTLLDTVTTGSGGAYSKSVTATTSGTTKFKAVYEGSSVNASAETDEYTCTASANPTNLNITVPALVYSDEFDVTGVLTDDASTPNPISGASVKLKWEVGGTQYESNAETTDSSGNVTFHRSAPTSITTYKFWLVYAGDSTYGGSTSSEVSKTVGKETTVLTVSSPSNNASFDSGDSVTVSGTLLTNDSEKLPSGTQVTIKEGNTTLGTANVSTSDGSFSTTISGLSDGSHTLTIAYAESTYYLGSSVTRNITLVADATLSTVTLSTDKSILSYVDSESATLTATPKTSQNIAIPGLPVIFYTGSPVVADHCNLEDNWTMINETASFSNSGILMHNACVMMYNESIFDLTTDSYRIYLTTTKGTNASEYLWLEILSSSLTGTNTAVKINDTTITFLGVTEYTPSGLDDTINVCIELTPSSQKLYIDGSQVASASVDYTSASYALQDHILLISGGLDEEYTVCDLVVYDSLFDGWISSSVSDSNGQATATYQSKDSVTESVVATCNNVSSSSVSIENCYKFHDLTSSTGLTWTQLEGTINQSYSSNGVAITGSGNACYAWLSNSFYPTGDYSVEFKITGMNSLSSPYRKCARIGIMNTFTESDATDSYISGYGSGTTWTTLTGVIWNVNDIMRCEYDSANNKVKYYQNDTYVGELACGGGSANGLMVGTMSTTGITIKDLKIKPL